MNVPPRSLALSLSSTSASLYSFSASSRMLPSLWKRKRSGMVMSSVLRPSPAIWNSGAVSLLLPSLSSERWREVSREQLLVRSEIIEVLHRGKSV